MRYKVYDGANVFQQGYSCDLGQDVALTYAKTLADQIQGSVYLQDGISETLVCRETTQALLAYGKWDVGFNKAIDAFVDGEASCIVDPVEGHVRKAEKL